MKTYNIVSPSLDGLLSDDHLFFEGVERPSSFFIFRDEDEDSKYSNFKNVETLEKYFNDIHNLFLKKLSTFVIEEPTTTDESIKLQGLLQELIKVKNLIDNATK